jgi:tRNA1(Val) A37 N6-methylase TrmN6
MTHDYYTPMDVARALARHAPRHLSSILEPSVGSGILLQPLLKRLGANAANVVCVDEDPQALVSLKKNTPLPVGNLEVICEDFLSWSKKKTSEARQFDCVLMNPPFAGKRSAFVELIYQADMAKVKKTIRRVPIEIAFVATAVKFLKPGGRLLAILPTSVIAAGSSRWLREYLLREGWVKYVHELPPFTFKKVSARTYLFVFERHQKQRTLILMNHDLRKPETLTVDGNRLAPNFRFDYGYNQALSTLRRLWDKRALKWTQLGDVATILRGEIDSPKGAQSAFHTTSYCNGFWTESARKNQLIKSVTERGIRANDLLVKRVGRNCSKTVGAITNAEGYAASDCLMIIRPRKSEDRERLLFALRVMLAGDIGSHFLESGAGASYLTAAQLVEMQIPINLDRLYLKTFLKYRFALEERDFAEMLRLERQARKRLFRIHQEP